MRKKLLSTILCAVMVGTLLTGCGNNAKTASNGSGTAKSTEAATEKKAATEKVAETEKTAANNSAKTVSKLGFGDYSDYKPAKTSYKFVFIPKLVHEWYEDVKGGIDVAVKELEQKGVKVEYTWDAPSDAIVTEQISKVEAAAATQPDGISLAVIDAAATKPVINDLISSGIHVSTFDVDAPDSNRQYYCGHSTNYEDGYQMAQILGKKLNGEGQVGILAGSLSAANHQDRVKGFQECMKKEFPNIKIVDVQADNDSVETALSVTEGWLSTYPELKGIFGCNGASPNGAARAVKDAGKSGKIMIVGMAEDKEAMGYVAEGTILATLKQTVSAYGYNSVYNMIRIADGKEPVVVNNDLPATVVTTDNVKDFQ